jgi:hypothetical protein
MMIRQPCVSSHAAQELPVGQALAQLFDHRGDAPAARRVFDEGDDRFDAWAEADDLGHDLCLAGESRSA